MADLKARVELKFELTLKLNEAEAYALDAIAGYGDDAFISVFYEKLGRAYLQPYVGALRGLLSAIRTQLGPQLAEVKKARGLLAAGQVRSGS